MAEIDKTYAALELSDTTDPGHTTWAEFVANIAKMDKQVEALTKRSGVWDETGSEKLPYKDLYAAAYYGKWAGDVLAAAKIPNLDASKITAGVLPVDRGGTGVTSEKALMLKFYRVGSLFFSYVSTSPASLFGGTWTQITGRFLRAANDTNTGGADTVTLTVAQIPSHKHPVNRSNFGAGRTDWGLVATGAHGGTVLVAPNTTADHSSSTYETGSGNAHSNVPAYQDFYVWRRTA